MIKYDKKYLKKKRFLISDQRCIEAQKPNCPGLPLLRGCSPVLPLIQKHVKTTLVKMPQIETSISAKGLPLLLYCSPICMSLPIVVFKDPPTQLEHKYIFFGC